MLNFGASKPRVRGGPRPPGPPPGSAPELIFDFVDLLLHQQFYSLVDTDTLFSLM